MIKVFNRASLFVIGLLVIAALYEVYTKSWSDLFVVSQAVIFSVIPFVIEHRYRINVPQVIRFGIVIFMFATLFLGEVNSFYDNYIWWDVALHTFAGFGLTLISLLLLILIYRESELRSTPFMTIVLAFSLTMLMAVFWELYEFAIDTFFEAEGKMQPNNQDTMYDFVATIVGASIVIIGGYRYLHKKSDGGFVATVLEEGKQKNSK